MSKMKLFHPRTGTSHCHSPLTSLLNLNHLKAHLGLVYMADPIVDDMKGPNVPLELYVVTFQSHSYTRKAGKI